MDFDRQLMESEHCGRYEELDPGLLPNLFVAYRTDLAEGSEVFHNNIRDRWMEGDTEVVSAMKDFAAYAQEARDLLIAGRGNEIGPLLDANFDRRRSIYKIDPANIAMVEEARAAGAHCKFAGSGGAIVGVYEDEAMYQRVRGRLETLQAAVLKPRIV